MSLSQSTRIIRGDTAQKSVAFLREATALGINEYDLKEENDSREHDYQVGKQKFSASSRHDAVGPPAGGKNLRRAMSVSVRRYIQGKSVVANDDKSGAWKLLDAGAQRTAPIASRVAKQQKPGASRAAATSSAPRLHAGLRWLCVLIKVVIVMKRGLNRRDIVVVPSLTIDPQLISKIVGAFAYEQRSLFKLLNLRRRRTRVCFVTSVEVASDIVDYYLNLVVATTDLTMEDVRSRLLLLSCHDSSPIALTQKILQRPRLLGRLKDWINHQTRTSLEVFISTEIEQELAIRLDLPLVGNDPSADWLGSKHGSRFSFAKGHVPHPDGCLEVFSVGELVGEIDVLLKRNPRQQQLVVKLNDGVSGTGNATLLVKDIALTSDDDGAERRAKIKRALETRMEFCGMEWEEFRDQFVAMGGIVECWCEPDEGVDLSDASRCGGGVRSPSVQAFISSPTTVEVLSTHEQILNGQVYLGCEFPTNAAYRSELMRYGAAVGKVLAENGAHGRFAIDFIAMPSGKAPDDYNLYAIEINLREGGTTHPFEVLKLITEGVTATDGTFTSRHTRRKKFYKATDNCKSASFKGLTPYDLIEITNEAGIGYNHETESGIVWHLLALLSEFGKCGFVAIADDEEQAAKLYDKAFETLNNACGLGKEEVLEKKKLRESNAAATAAAAEAAVAQTQKKKVVNKKGKKKK